MKVHTNQDSSFVDSIVEIPSSELDKISEVITWNALNRHLSCITSDYQPLSLFKALILQVLYNLSDKRLSDSLHRDLVFMKFCGFSIKGNKPDEATICRFRNKLQQTQLLDKLFSVVNQEIEKNGYTILPPSTYIVADATLIASARRPKKQLNTKKVNKENNESSYESTNITYSDDKEATWVQKGKRTVYGYNAYMGANKDGIIVSVGLTSANKSEMSHFSTEALPKQLPRGSLVLYDKGADSKKNREVLKSKGLRDGIMRRKVKGKNMTSAQKRRNKIISQKRSSIERIFGTIKRVYGFNRARYIGLEKVKGEALLKATAYNLKRFTNYMQLNYQKQAIA